jgi:hypothetical protein
MRRSRIEMIFGIRGKIGSAISGSHFKAVAAASGMCRSRTTPRRGFHQHGDHSSFEGCGENR